MDINSVMIDPTDDGVREDLAKKSTRPGEEALIFAVLKSATEDFQEYVNARDRKGKLSFSQAQEWFLDETSDSLFCFENICEVLRIKANYFRRGLLRWKEAHQISDQTTHSRYLGSEQERRNLEGESLIV
jgi:hypothetical protein